MKIKKIKKKPFMKSKSKYLRLLDRPQPAIGLRFQEALASERTTYLAIASISVHLFLRK